MASRQQQEEVMDPLKKAGVHEGFVMGTNASIEVRSGGLRFETALSIAGRRRLR